MKTPYIPPRWFGLFTFSAGLYAAIYLAMTCEDFWTWLLPTGLISIVIVCAGAKWTIRPRKTPLNPRS